MVQAQVSVVVATLLSAGACVAEVQLPATLGDNMVIQRDMPVRIWGWASPGEKVAVELSGQKGEAKAGDDKRWEVRLPAMKAGGPYEVVVEGTNRLVLKNVMVGEIWLCSGQSNMAWPVFKAHNHEKALADAEQPRVRLLTVPEKFSKEPLSDIKASWLMCNRRTISYFSAVGYFFGRELERELDVPVGLIMSAVNGTRIEPWTPGTGVASVKELAGIDKAENGELYNGMIHPVTTLPIRGVIWYQGEGNVGDSSSRYFHRMQALIEGYRKAWGQPDMPIYYVQIAPLNWGGKAVDVHPKVWEAQRRVLSIKHTGMAITTDIVHHTSDAHPLNKVDVGRRLSLWALAKTYGKKDIAYSGPIYRELKIEGNKARVVFDFADGLMARDGKPLSWFTVAGADGKFHPAKAEIDGETVVVSAEEVSEPKWVRLGWHQIAQPNLINRHKLPASPFTSESD